MAKQFCYGNKDRETVSFRTTQEISDWLHAFAFQEGQSLALFLTEHFEHYKAMSDAKRLQVLRKQTESA